MTFQASKLRIRRIKPMGRGKPIVPSVGIEAWYSKSLHDITDAMISDYYRSIENVMETDDAKNYFAMDASLTSIFKKVLKDLSNKWNNVFKAYANKTATEFVDKAEHAATASTLFSISAAGVPEPRSTYSENIKNTMSSFVEMNKTLITNIQAEEHEKIFTVVMLSLSSPDKEKQGQKAIKEALAEIGIHAKNRVDLIVRDQNSKLYSSIATERMIQNGVEKFEWSHSSAGKVPRQTHLSKNGEIFLINDPRLWTGPKADQGPPGWAINCRCRMIPIIE